MSRDLSRAKPVIELFQKGAEEPCAWVCGECHIAQGSKEAAQACHAPSICDGCGADIGNSYCRPCHEKKSAAATEAARAKAKQVPLAEYDGEYLSCPNCEEFIGTEEDLDDHFERDATSCERLGWAFGCYEQRLSLDADRIIEWALDDHHEDACERVDASTLQPVLDAWVKEHGSDVVSYFEDRSVVVLLHPAESEEAA